MIKFVSILLSQPSGRGTFGTINFQSSFINWRKKTKIDTKIKNPINGIKKYLCIQLLDLYNKNILGPFRTAYNAGDVITNSIVNTDIRYGRESSQVNGNNLSRVQVRGDGLNRNGSAMFSGNPRFVYDGSDYIRFKKLQAINKNYHDYSLGGANNSQSQHAINRVR